MKSPRVSLHLGPSFEPAWQNVLLPWFRAVSATAWQQTALTLAVVPCRSYAYFLKTRILAAKLPVIGNHFVTPAELREMLSEKRTGPLRIPPREHLQLLLRAAAERRLDLGNGAQGNEPPYLAAKAVATAPEPLLRVIDQLSAGGWSFSATGPAVLRPLVADFFSLVEHCGFEFVHDSDRAALEYAKTHAPIFSNVLIAGFNAAHWPVAPLLHAAAHAAADATVWLTDPRDEARELDESWIGAWEQEFAAAETIAELAAERPQPFAEIVRLPEGKTAIARRAAAPNSAIHFLAARTILAQARAVAAMAMHFLAEDSCARLGILFPGPGPLARHVAVLLEKAGVPHNDGLAHPAPGPFENDAWHAWLELQENPQLARLIQFLRAHPDAPRVFGDLRIDRIEDGLRRAFNDLLIDDLEVLREYCARQRDDSFPAELATGLSRIPFLPEKAALAEFLAETKSILEGLGWSEKFAAVWRLTHDWSSRLNLPISRRIYLDWLAAITRSFRSVREVRGDHPYSRVCLLPYAQAEGQVWSHLILAGLNEGQWPPPFDESGYLREEDLDVLNARIMALNRRAVGQGNQGEGHMKLRQGKTLCLGPVQERQLALRQFFNIIESVEHGLAAAVSLHDEEAPSRWLNPSDFFTRLYFGARGRSLAQSALASLERETRAWLDGFPSEHEDVFADPEDIQQTRVAYDARRQPGQEAGEYEFALWEPIGRTLVLSATDWEKVLTAPSIVWLKKMLGVEGRDEGEGDPWSLATGQWVHRWLGRISGAASTGRFVKTPATRDFSKLARTEADRFREDTERLLAACERVAPDWWISGWKNAVYMADCLTRKFADLESWPRMATEWPLASPQPISLGEGRILNLRGRIDLILARGEPGRTSALRESDVWVIDYKTGNRKGLAPSRPVSEDQRFAGVRKKLGSGDGVQLALYALSLRALGAEKIGISLLSRGVVELNAQWTLADVEAQTGFWRELHRMQETGVFGMRGELRSEFSFSGAHPLATLPVDRDLLEEKWALTHPVFASGEDRHD